MCKFHIIIILSFFILTTSCKNNDALANNNTSEIIVNNELQNILINHKAQMVEIDKRYNINGQKEILNQLMKNNDFLAHKNYKSTLENIKKAGSYFDTISKKNNIVFENTLNKIEKINQNKLDSKEISKIVDAQSALTLLQTNGTVYHIQISLLISKLYETVNQIEDCKHIIQNNEVLFYNDECLQKYDKLIMEIQKLQIECNNIKAKYKEIESTYN